MTKRDLILWVMFVIGSVSLGVYFAETTSRHAKTEKILKVGEPVQTIKTPTAAAEHYQVSTIDPKSISKDPLPGIEKSDLSIDESFNQLLGKGIFSSLFVTKDFIRKVVVTVDGGMGKELPADFSPVKELDGKFNVMKVKGGLYINLESDTRYLPYVRLLQKVDLKKMVELYVYYYPLFQAAYSELGTKGYFNDRLVRVIDNALSSPKTVGEIKLVQPSVYYQFEDPALEGLSAAQKIMIRIGPEYANRVKVRLRELRELLIHLEHR